MLCVDALFETWDSFTQMPGIDRSLFVPTQLGKISQLERSGEVML